ncbi:MAG: isocitrate/isopropylmalate dehydrogenase family protein [Methanomassiliicoccales archaeon]|nr:isocitrate/isopropylmalate dehydrogenase family protein [Methanomassiliicoccales archaeon]
MKKIAVIGGDGIGPEVVSCAVRLIENLDVDLEFIPAEMGLECYRKTGSFIPDATMDALEQSDACLFGAVTTSLEEKKGPSILFLRKHFDLYANVRPVKRLHPSVGLVDLDVVIVRENTEGMYTGIEHADTDGVTLERRVSEKASRRIVRFALRLCKDEKRRRLTCVHKANAMRMSDGLFRRVFFEEASNSDIESREMLVDAAAAALVLRPKDLDCIVTLNLYGDILSDEAAALVGGLGFGPSGNIGDRYAIFEPSHGSAPDIAGTGTANPIAAILSGAMMLRYLGEYVQASRIEKVVRLGLSRGVKTIDVGGTYKTATFTDALIGMLDEV